MNGHYALSYTNHTYFEAHDETLKRGRAVVSAAEL